ncbi:hypothetical protein AC578_4238 [Pseudocercospora eumusae]|uniref:Uncharacterized protein n=1 Tax=Pseudocercospora eumusae TaxID=321146 RepID=A0A139H3H8_9PEZI|nr:hypothetical protein AC578_4238 [Pseudocercospora eumusae]
MAKANKPMRGNPIKPNSYDFYIPTVHMPCQTDYKLYMKTKAKPSQDSEEAPLFGFATRQPCHREANSVPIAPKPLGFKEPL